MNYILRFVLDGQLVELDFQKTKILPSTTVLNYLRSLPGHRGTKEGCAEGDCGACTVVLGELKNGRISYKAVDSCLLYLPAIHGKQLITVENLAIRNGKEIRLHPVQEAMVAYHGSQCGFCTPGMVMALFTLYKSNIEVTRYNLIQSLAGNLCRCTGYEPILEAALMVCSNRQPDHFDAEEHRIIELLERIHSRGKSLEVHTPKQKYSLPESLEQALEFRRLNPKARIINGATDTAIRQNKTHEFLAEIIDLSAVDELKSIAQKDDGFFVGAGVSLEAFKSFAHVNLPQLIPMLEVFASWQIRNVATVGGNLATASPIGDLIPIYIALKSQVELRNQTGSRWVSIEEFITGYRSNCLMDDELLINIFIPRIGSEIVLITEKVSTRRDLDISTLSIAMRSRTNTESRIEEIILAYGGMADRPKRAAQTENFLIGKMWSRDTLEQAQNYIEMDFTPISDARAGAGYRMMVAKNLLLKMLFK